MEEGMTWWEEYYRIITLAVLTLGAWILLPIMRTVMDPGTLLGLVVFGTLGGIVCIGTVILGLVALHWNDESLDYYPF